MKTKIIYLLTPFLLIFVACQKDDKDRIIIDSKKDFEVGAKGANLTLKIASGAFWYGSCVRYTTLDTVEFIPGVGPQEEAYWDDDTISFENITVWREERNLNVKIGPNDLTIEKRFYIGLRGGNIFEGINILQEGRKE